MSQSIGIGAALREARERKSLTLSDCENAVCIRTRYLTAIEEGRFSDLPDPAYVSGFVRAYADFLDVQVEGVSAPDRDLPVPGVPERKARLSYLTASRPRRRRYGPRRRPAARVLITLLIIAAIVIIAFWFGVFDTSQVGAPPN